MALHSLLEVGGVAAVEEAHAAAAFDAVGVVDAHHEAHVVAAVVTPLLLGVKLAGAVLEVVAAGVRHERCRAQGLPSSYLAVLNPVDARWHGRQQFRRVARCVRWRASYPLSECDPPRESGPRSSRMIRWHRRIVDDVARMRSSHLADVPGDCGDTEGYYVEVGTRGVGARFCWTRLSNGLAAWLRGHRPSCGCRLCVKFGL